MMVLLPVLALALQASASAAPVGAPQWLRKPTAEEVRAAYPAEAAAQGVGGFAYLRCRLESDTKLHDCNAYGEAPQGTHFAKAIAPLTADWRIKPDPPGQSVEMPIRFDPPTPAPGALPVDLHVVWSTAPTKAEVEAAYPKSARAAGMQGVGIMACAVYGGQLGDCRAVRDDSFSRAAIRLAPRFTLGATFARNRSTEGLVLNVPVSFGASAKAASAAPLPWVTQPSADQIAAAFPIVARQQGYGLVQASARCRAATDGSLLDCQATHEDPVGVGGAQAAVQLASVYRLSAWTPDGLPTAGRIVEFTVALKPR